MTFGVFSMGCAATVVDLLASALQKEEAELKDLAGRCSRPCLESICQFDEGRVTLAFRSLTSAIKNLGAALLPGGP